MQPDINSQAAWDYRFQHHWGHHGEAQTAFFARVCLEQIPHGFTHWIRKNQPSILDWGCALGNALPVFRRAFPKSNLSGYDFSEVAITKAKQALPTYHFMTSLDKLKQKPDIVYCSNYLEHMQNPQSVLESEILPWTAHYLIILVPYKEAQLQPDHLHRFDEYSLPRSLRAKTSDSPTFGLCYARIVYTGAYPNSYWPWHQLLLIYAHEKAKGLQDLIQSKI